MKKFEVNPISHKKTLHLFSQGTINPIQGGSGLFNFQIAEYFISNDYKFCFYTNAAKDFLGDHQLSHSEIAQLISDNNPLVNYETVLNNLHISSLSEFSAESFSSLLDKANDQKIIIFSNSWLYYQKYFQNIACLVILSDLASLRHAEVISNCLSKVSLRLSTFLLLWHHLINFFQAKFKEYLLFKNLRFSNNTVSTFSPYEYFLIKKHIPNITLTRWFTPYHAINSSPRIINVRLNKTLRFLLVGDMNSTASWSIVLSVLELVKAINSLPSDYAFEFHFVGKASLQSEGIFCKVNTANIKYFFHGQVDTLTPFFTLCDIYLAIGDYRCGIRTRIITAFSYGIPVIASTSFSYGLIDPVDKYNWLLINDNNELVKILTQILDNQINLSKIGQAGRELWERCYNPKINIAILANQLFSK